MQLILVEDNHNDQLNHEEIRHLNSNLRQLLNISSIAALISEVLIGGQPL